MDKWSLVKFTLNGEDRYSYTMKRELLDGRGLSVVALAEPDMTIAELYLRLQEFLSKEPEYWGEDRF